MPKFEFLKIFLNRGQIVHENIEDHKIVECDVCNGQVIPYWEPRYNGVRATCKVCGINWQES